MRQAPVGSRDGHQVAFVRDNNIYLVKLLYGNAESQVTKDGKFNEIINGIPDWVNEEEFSTNKSLCFTADSDALIVKGIIALLIQVLSGHTAQEILDADLYFIDRIGLREHLSPTRSNGLLAMVKRIKAYALVYNQ